MTTPKPHVARRIAEAQRKAQPGTCPRCRRPILTGWDRDDVASIARVDVEPISAEVEFRALAAGLATYDLDRGELHYREPWHFVEAPRYPIHVWHVCR